MIGNVLQVKAGSSILWLFLKKFENVVISNEFVRNFTVVDFMLLNFRLFFLEHHFFITHRNLNI